MNCARPMKMRCSDRPARRRVLDSRVARRIWRQVPGTRIVILLGPIEDENPAPGHHLQTVCQSDRALSEGGPSLTNHTWTTRRAALSEAGMKWNITK
jgi:hypothetical protein